MTTVMIPYYANPVVTWSSPTQPAFPLLVARVGSAAHSSPATSPAGGPAVGRPRSASRFGSLLHLRILAVYSWPHAPPPPQTYSGRPGQARRRRRKTRSPPQLPRGASPPAAELPERRGWGSHFSQPGVLTNGSDYKSHLLQAAIRKAPSGSRQSRGAEGLPSSGTARRPREHTNALLLRREDSSVSPPLLLQRAPAKSTSRPEKTTRANRGRLLARLPKRSSRLPLLGVARLATPSKTRGSRRPGLVQLGRSCCQPPPPPDRGVREKDGRGYSPGAGACRFSGGGRASPVAAFPWSSSPGTPVCHHQ